MRTRAITIFTTTYNRAYILPQLYESLVSQTSKDFVWLIIDDGSKDNTRELVASWINKNLICIKYIHQVNKGMLGGHNTAYDNIETYLNVCIDSDDYMPNNAIERILTLWKKYGSNKIAGIGGLDAFKNGEIIGRRFPENLKEVFFHDLIDKYKVIGDKKYVFRTDVINEVGRYPNFKGEKFPAQSYLYRLISQKYTILVFNEVFCIVEYLDDGNTKNKFNSYKQNAVSFSFYRKEMIRLSKSYNNKLRHAIHYISSCLFAKKKIFYGENTVLLIIALPFGILLNLYLQNTSRKTFNSK